MRFLRSLIVLGLLSLLHVSSGTAGITHWTIQSASSSLTLNGNFSSGGSYLASLQSQSPGNSLTTSYAGTITTTTNIFWNDDPLLTIQFAGGNIVAANSGNWDPIPGGSTGTAPANYGAAGDFNFLGGARLAVRDLVAQLASDTIVLSGTAPATQTFSSNVTLEYLSGISDYRAFGPVGAVLDDYDPTMYAGESETFLSSGSIAWGIGGLATLTIPVNIPFYALINDYETPSPSDDFAVFGNFTGQIVATAVVPEASSLVLLGLAGSMIGFIGYRRNRK